MRTYEALYIVRPELSDEETQTISKEVEQLVVDNGGTIVRSETWGKRRLAFEIDKLNEGIYILLRFECQQEVVEKLEKFYRLNEQVMRSLVTYFDEKTLRLEAEQEKRKEEDLKHRNERDESGDIIRRGSDDRDAKPAAKPAAAEATPAAEEAAAPAEEAKPAAEAAPAEEAVAVEAAPAKDEA